MVKGLATFYVKEDKVKSFLDLVKKVIDETVKEKGCLEYAAYREKHKSNVFTFFEEWETQEDLDAHLRSEHIARLIPQMAPFLERGIDVRIFTSAY